MNNYLKFFIFITSFLLLFHFYLSNYKHKFWYKQPVSRTFFNNKEGVIIKPKYLTIDDNINENYSWNTINNINEFKNFLQNNYSKSEHYNANYLKWILNTPYKHITKLSKISNRSDINIALYHTNKLIGTITGRPIILKINKNIVEGFYVDFLCVHKKYRNKGLTPKLISKLLSEWKKYKLDMHIFKIDNNPLPFDNIGYFNYYYYDLSIVNKFYASKNADKSDCTTKVDSANKFDMTTKVDNANKFDMKTFNNKLIKDVNIKKLNEKYVERAYEFFHNSVQRYKLYQIFTLDEFKYYFLSNNHIKTYITLKNNIITSFFTFTKMKYNHPFQKNKTAQCIELTYFLTNESNIIYNFINMFKKYDFLIFLDAMQNKELVDILKPHKGHKTYYQLYNYYTCVKNDDIGLMIV